MTTIKFDRPQGEARLEWIEGLGHYADGGLIQVFVDDKFFGNYIQGEMCTKAQSTPPAILAEAEKLRNERRRLAADEIRWADGGVEKMTMHNQGGPVVKIGRGRIWFPGGKDWPELPTADKTQEARATAFLLANMPADYCIDGSLRRMDDDEVRGLEGEVYTMSMTQGNRVFMPFKESRGDATGFWWSPGRNLDEARADNPAHDPSQLARLQAFWDANQPKEDGPLVELAEEAKPKCQKCNGTGRSCGDRRCPYQWCTPCIDCGPLAKSEPARVTDVRFMAALTRPCVRFKFERSTRSYSGAWEHSDHLRHRLHPSDIALIERCWADGQKSTGGPASAQTDAVASADSGAARAVLTEAHSVTPPGEAKAPFGLEWDFDGEVFVGPLRIVVDDEGDWDVDVFEDPRPGTDPETFLRALHASLSDHIRRGDGNGLPAGYRWMRKRCGHVSDTPQRVCPECGDDDGTTMPIKESAPDLSELREAERKRQGYRAAVPFGCRDLATSQELDRAVFAAVERLVGK
jgi:hypothetical protein